MLAAGSVAETYEGHVSHVLCLYIALRVYILAEPQIHVEYGPTWLLFSACGPPKP